MPTDHARLTRVEIPKWMWVEMMKLGQERGLAGQAMVRLVLGEALLAMGVKGPGGKGEWWKDREGK